MAVPYNEPVKAFDDLVTLTLRYQESDMFDNLSEHNALYNRLVKRGNVKKVAGGDDIHVPLLYAENSTYQRYSGYETLNIQESDSHTVAKFAWKQAAVNITASGLEIRKNSGNETKIKDLVEARIEAAKITFANNMCVDMYSDGTGSGGKQINGLQALVSDAGTGTVGGIDSSTWAFWRNVVQSAASPLQGGGAITVSASTIQSLMRPLYTRLTRGTDKVDLIMSDENYFNFYEQSLSDQQRFTASNMAEAGFSSLKFKGADVVHDSSDSGMPTNHMYFLNTKYIQMIMHPDADMKPMESKSAVNQDAMVKPIIFMGNMVVRNRSLQGVLKA